MYFILKDISLLGSIIARKGDIVNDSIIELNLPFHYLKINKIVPEPGHQYVLVRDVYNRKKLGKYSYCRENTLIEESTRYGLTVNGREDLSYHFIDVTEEPRYGTDKYSILKAIGYKFKGHINPFLTAYLSEGKEIQVLSSENIIEGATAITLVGKHKDLDLMIVEGTVPKNFYIGYYNDGLKVEASSDPEGYSKPNPSEHNFLCQSGANKEDKLIIYDIHSATLSFRTRPGASAHLKKEQCKKLYDILKEKFKFE